MTKLKEVYEKKKCEEVTTYVSAGEKIKDTSITKKYYDLVTDFFEFGWGKSFHFAPQLPGEDREEAMLKHELKIAKALDLKPGMKVLDVGCGVAGPMKNIASHSGASITGLNINPYQIQKAQKYIKECKLENTCSFHEGNFMDTKLPSESFDAIYAIEATVHAPDYVKCYQEVRRLLKPGASFSGYVYALLDNFDPNNKEHVQIIEDLEHGGGLQKTPDMEGVKKFFVDAGFEIVEITDDCTENHTWTLPLEKGIRSSKMGRFLTNIMVRVLETLKIAPKGTTQVSSFLNLGADAFVQAGKRRIFTPNVFFHVRKPLT